MIRFFFPRLNARMVADSANLIEALAQITQILRWSNITDPGPVEIYQTVYEGILSREVKIAG